MTWLIDTVDVDDRWCLVHATHADDGELERIAASGATVGLCPITESNLGDGIFPAAQFQALDGSYGIGSDSNVLDRRRPGAAVLEYSQRLARQCPQLSWHRVTVARPAGRFLSARSTGGSRALGVTDVGLRVGAAADLISLDSNHDALHRAGRAMRCSIAGSSPPGRPPSTACGDMAEKSFPAGGTASAMRSPRAIDHRLNDCSLLNRMVALPHRSLLGLNKLVGRSFERAAGFGAPEDDLVDLAGQGEVFVGDAPFGVGVKFDPELAPGDR